MESFRNEEKSEYPYPTDVVEKFPDEDDLREPTAEEERQFYESDFGRRLDELSTDEDKRNFVQGLSERVRPWFEERDIEAWRKFTAGLEDIDGGDPDAPKALSSSAYELRSSVFDNYSAFEHEIRKSMIKDQGFAPLTPDLGIGYHIEDDEAHLHYMPSRSIKNHRKQMSEGSKKLAELISTVPALQSVKGVAARSEIVAERPRIFTNKKSGFHLVQEEGKTVPDLARISREDFLKLWV